MYFQSYGQRKGVLDKSSTTSGALVTVTHANSGQQAASGSQCVTSSVGKADTALLDLYLKAMGTFHLELCCDYKQASGLSVPPLTTPKQRHLTPQVREF